MNTMSVTFAESVTRTGTSCPACHAGEGTIFFEVANVPAHQVRLVRSFEDAIACPRGDIRLAVCGGCGFIWNSSFDPDLIDYDEDYESTQAVSPTFERFHEQLARDVVARYDLSGKDVVEIGCGQGEFLHLLRRFGARSATGFDPVLRDLQPPPGVTLVKDWYSETHSELAPDFVASKMVMEHVPDPARYLTMLRRTMGDRPEAITFAMMPEVTRILTLRAFWDVYFEHCTYFSLGSLARAFRTAGFDVVDLSLGYGDQYALIAARPGDGTTPALANEETPEQMVELAMSFARATGELRRRWTRWLENQASAGRRVVLWGGGSKGVAFLTGLQIEPDMIEYAVDINPKRWGTYIAGTGQRIVGPDFLTEQPPDYLVVMSPIYRDEIAAQLSARRLAPRIVSVEDGPPEH